MKADALPLWDAPPAQMAASVNAWLDEQRYINPPDETWAGFGTASRWLAQIAAYDNNLQPLQALYPSLADFLQPRKRMRGTWSRHSRPWALQQAIDDVARIRALWPEKYGRQYRRKDQISAETIAAERWGIDEETLRRALK